MKILKLAQTDVPRKPDVMTDEERDRFGLTTKDQSMYNAFQDIAGMIRERQALAPEQRMAQWKTSVEADIDRLGYHQIPRLFDPADKYALALRRGGRGYEAFKNGFQGWQAADETPRYPTKSKAQLGKTIASFATLEEASEWIKQKFSEMEGSDKGNITANASSGDTRNFLLDLDNWGLIESHRDIDKQSANTWDVVYSNALLNDNAFLTTNPKFVDILKHANFSAYNVKTEENIDASKLAQLVLNVGDERDFWVLVNQNESIYATERSIEKRDVEMGDDQRPGHYEMYGSDELRPQADAKSLWQMPRFAQSELKDCQRCKGKGGYYTKLRNPRGGSQSQESYVPCDMPGCHNGKYDPSTLCQECHDADGHELPIGIIGKPKATQTSKSLWQMPRLAQQVFGEPATYTYHINLDERGSFYADVRNSSGKTVFEIKAGNEIGPDESSIFDDGFMKHPHDLDGLKQHLVNLGIMSPKTKLVDGNVSSSRMKPDKRVEKKRVYDPTKPWTRMYDPELKDFDERGTRTSSVAHAASEWEPPKTAGSLWELKKAQNSKPADVDQILSDLAKPAPCLEDVDKIAQLLVAGDKAGATAMFNGICKAKKLKDFEAVMLSEKIRKRVKELDVKTAAVIPDDGIADGGEPYTDEEMDLMEAQSKPKKWHIKVTFDDGDTIETQINGTQDEIRRHYLTNDFELANEKSTHRGVQVEFVKELGEVPWTYYGESARPKP